MFDTSLDTHLSDHAGQHRTQAPERVVGVIVKFDQRRGFGFIEVAGRADVFVHISEIERARRRGDLPETYALDGKLVSFRVAPDRHDQTKCKAVDLRLAELDQ